MLTIDNIPLRVHISKNKIVSLNLNNYRNLHYQVNNKAKKNMLETIRNGCVIDGCIDSPPVALTYTIYRRDKRMVDIMNIGSVLDKFVSDALVTLGYLPDDNTDYIKKVSVLDGGINKQNPHAKLEVKEFSEDNLYYPIG